MLRELRPTLILLLAFTVLTGLIYPLAITGVAQLVWKEAANGSVIVRNGQPVGSRLIGQPFSDATHFWGRPSATAPQPYNGLGSSGSNLGPTNPALVDQVTARVKSLHAADPANTQPIPAELVLASASGLDPDISPAAARWQAARVAQARHLPTQSVRMLIEQHTRPAPLGFLGEARINVLELNLALDDVR